MDGYDRHIESSGVIIMTRYVWLNTQTGEFTSSWDEETHEEVKHLLGTDSDEWKLIKYTCETDQNFEFNNLMRIA